MDEDELKELVYTHGPVAVGYNDEALPRYNGGIIDNKICEGFTCKTALIVGYGAEDEGRPFWIVKNYQGANWGENGYFRIIRGKQKCGINFDVTATHLKQA
jgi:cathepsin F